MYDEKVELRDLLHAVIWTVFIAWAELVFLPPAVIIQSDVHTFFSCLFGLGTPFLKTGQRSLILLVAGDVMSLADNRLAAAESRRRVDPYINSHLCRTWK